MLSSSAFMAVSYATYTCMFSLLCGSRFRDHITHCSLPWRNFEGRISWLHQIRLGDCADDDDDDDWCWQI